MATDGNTTSDKATTDEDLTAHFVQVTGASHIYRVLVPLDDTVRYCTADDCAPEEVQVIFEGKGTLIFIDQYDHGSSHSSYCQAGRERFLRIVRIPREAAKAGKTKGDEQSTLRSDVNIKLESCFDNIELLEEGVVNWIPSTSTLRIDWLSGPGREHTEQSMTFQFREDG